MSHTLLATKLFVPPVRPGLVPRPRLMEKLDRGLEQKLALVSAPAGFGKTTLLSSWVRGRERFGTQLRTAWLSLDEGDNDPARFLAYLVASLQTVTDDKPLAASLGQELLAALQTPGARQASLPLEELLTPLINDLASLSEHLLYEQPAALEPRDVRQESEQGIPMVHRSPRGPWLSLVLDDYHVIETEPIHDALTFLLTHLPPRVHVVILTRNDPPLPIARLRGQGQLNEVRQSDLSFTAEEAAQFLSASLEMGLSADESAALASRTEGWIAGLQMASLAIQSRLNSPYPTPAEPPSSPFTSPRGGNILGFIEAFAGSDRFIMDYLMEEVLECQPQGIQAFLLQTSILERLTGPLCDAVVTGQQMAKRVEEAISPGSTLADLPFSESDGQEMLEHLERANLFVVALDESRQWYRYHHLFSDLLRQHLSRVRPDLVPTLHQRASAWYERNDQPAAAIHHALAAGDFVQAADLIEKIADVTWMRSEVATFLNWVEALPRDLIRARPMLGVYYAMALLMGGYPLEVVESRLRDAAGHEAASALAIPEAVEPTLPMHAGMTVVHALVAAYQGRSGESAELAQRALELLPQESLFLRSLVTGILGLAHLYGDDFHVAARMLQKAVQVSQQAGNVMNGVLALCHLAELALMQGQLRRARELYEQALSKATDEQGRQIPVAGIALSGLGPLLLEWNELEAAQGHLEQGIALSEMWGEAGAISGYGTLARVRQATGDYEGAHQLLNRAEEIAARFDAMEIDDIGVAARKADLSVAEGNLHQASTWAEQRGLKRDPSLAAMDIADLGSSFLGQYLRVGEYMTFARLLVALGRMQPDASRESLQEAEALLATLLGWAETEGRGAIAVQAMVLCAVTHQELGNRELALESLERALSQAEPEGYVRSFVQEGRPMAELLRLAASRGLAPAYVRRLRSAMQPRDDFARNGEPADQVTPAAQEHHLVDPLSDRELEVLRFLPGSLSSTEIADQLIISVNTVRSHIRSIYSKLDVHSRYEAIGRAQELNLI